MMQKTVEKIVEKLKKKQAEVTGQLVYVFIQCFVTLDKCNLTTQKKSLSEEKETPPAVVHPQSPVIRSQHRQD